MMRSKYTTLNVTSKFSSNDCLTFEFKIDKFSCVTNVITSRLISSCACKTAWRVLVETSPWVNVNNFGRRTVSPQGKMRVGLKRADSNKCDVKALFFFKVLNSRGLVYFKESLERVFSRTHAEFYCDYVKRPGKIAQVCGIREAVFALHDDKLTIQGYVIITDCCTKNTEDDLNSVMELQYNFRDLYKNNLFSDVVFVFEKAEIPAHKAVLSARSPVFKRMFEHDMIESEFNTVKITDVERNMFDKFLNYVYTGVIGTKDLSTILSLYTTADKYQVNALFKTCSNILASYISEKTVPSILMHADMHSDDILKEKAVQFIYENFTLVEGTSEWYNLIDADPRLGSYVLTAVALNTVLKR